METSPTGTDATKIVGKPGTVPSGKMYAKTGELLSNEEYARRTEEDEAVMGYDEQIAALKAAAAAVNQETPEQKEKRERMEKSKKVIAATADGLSALSNLFFTTQYAPNAYNPQSSQLGKVNGRIEALKAERQADADRYTNLMLRLGDTQNARAKTLRDVRAQHEAQKLAREKAERDAEAHSWQALLQPDKQREQKGKADKAGYEAESSRLESENKPKELDLENKYREAGINQRKAAATASYAAAENSKAHAEETRNTGFYGTFDGKKYYTKVDYDKAVRRAAEEYNKRNQVKVKKTRKKMGADGNYVVDEKGNAIMEEYVESQDPVPTYWLDGVKEHEYESAHVAGALEPLLEAERKKDSIPPSRRNNDDNVPPYRRR